MSYYKDSPDEQPMYIQYTFRQRTSLQGQAAEPAATRGRSLGDKSLHPGMEHVAEKLRRQFGEKAEAFLDLAGSEPVNINIFPNLSLLGNHIQVFQPISLEETDTIWYGTKIEDVDGTMGPEFLNEINTLRMRTQEGFPNFGEVDDITNFEQIRAGFAARKTNGPI